MPSVCRTGGGSGKPEKQIQTKLKVALLSNSTGRVREDVRESLSKIDYPVLKIDAGTKIKFEEVNRLATGVNFSDILDSLSSVEHLFGRQARRQSRVSIYHKDRIYRR